jgi:chemotaxis signal transduction protein
VSHDESSAPSVAAALKRAFDSGFALPRAERAEGLERFVGVEASGHAYAFRVREIAGLVPAKDIVPLPQGEGAPAGLLGLCGIHGALVPVFGLAALLGDAAQHESAPRWLILLGRAGDGHLGRVAFGADGLAGYVEAPRSRIHAAAPGARSRHVTEVLEAPGAFRSIVNVDSLVQAIKKES